MDDAYSFLYPQNLSQYLENERVMLNERVRGAKN